MTEELVTRGELERALHELEVRLDTRQARLEERMGSLIADMKAHIAGFVTQVQESVREARVHRAEIFGSNRELSARIATYTQVSDATHAQVDRNGRQLDRAIEGINSQMKAFEASLITLHSEVGQAVETLRQAIQAGSRPARED